MKNDSGLDFSLFSKELRLLLVLMKKESAESILSNHKELFTDVNWNLFLQLVRHHRVYPGIYKMLKKVDEKGIPAYVIQSLYQDYHKNTFQMLRLSGAMEQVCKSFTENNVRTLLLKGPTLAVDLYGDISLRTSGDLDILIPIKELDKVDQLLIKLGYVKEDFFSTVLNGWRWRHHHVNYFHTQTKIKLEIHWRLNPGPSPEPSFKELWERKRISTLTSYPVYTLGCEDLFLFLASHGARHGWSRLRWLADIDQIVKLKMDWVKLNLLLRKYHYPHIGGQALILTSQLLHTPISEEMRSLTVGSRPTRLAQDALFYIKQMVNLHTDPISEDVSRYHKRHLFSLMSTQQKFFFIMSFLYPYPEDAEVLPLPKLLHVLYFPLRPVLWAWRKTKKHILL